MDLDLSSIAQEWYALVVESRTCACCLKETPDAEVMFLWMKRIPDEDKDQLPFEYIGLHFCKECGSLGLHKVMTFQELLTSGLYIIENCPNQTYQGMNNV